MSVLACIGEACFIGLVCVLCSFCISYGCCSVLVGVGLMLLFDWCGAWCLL